MAKKKTNSELESNVKKREGGIGGLFIPAGILIGMGIGFLEGNIPAWMFIGLGTGFLCFAISLYLEKKK